MKDKRAEILKTVKMFETPTNEDIQEMLKPDTVDDDDITKFLLKSEKVELKSINIEDGTVEWEWKGER